MDTKRILFLLRHAPYASSHALEALETALVAGVFEQQVSVLFCDDGVWQLVDGQDGAVLDRRTIARIVQALPQYEIRELYACADALRVRGLAPADLALPVTVVDAAAQRALLAAQDAVVND